MFRVSNVTRKQTVADRVEKATTLFKRMKGLLGRPSLEEGTGLWIEPCNSIHTFFMKFPIDVVFVSSSRKVLRVWEKLPPFRLTSMVGEARSVLELPAGTLQQFPIQVGDELLLEEVS